VRVKGEGGMEVKKEKEEKEEKEEEDDDDDILPLAKIRRRVVVKKEEQEEEEKGKGRGGKTYLSPEAQELSWEMGMNPGFELRAQ